MRDPFTLDATGVTLTIRATPKASKTAVTGVVALEGDATALGLRVAAPPVDGAANDEVVRFVAKQLRVGRSAVTLVAGATARVKRLRIEGDAVAMEASLQALLLQAGPPLRHPGLDPGSRFFTPAEKKRDPGSSPG